MECCEEAGVWMSMIVIWGISVVLIPGYRRTDWKRLSWLRGENWRRHNGKKKKGTGRSRLLSDFPNTKKKTSVGNEGR